MKKLFTFLAFALVLTLSTGCDDWFEIKTDGTIPEGATFFTGCPIAIYFVDEEGNDLICEDETTSWPTAFNAPAMNISAAFNKIEKQNYNNSILTLYNNDSNSLFFDEAIGLVRFQTYLWGVTPETTARMYVYHGEVEDKMIVTYKYLTAADNVQISGGDWTVTVTSIKYNDVEVYAGNDSGRVYIVNGKDGKVTVKTGSLN